MAKDKAPAVDAVEIPEVVAPEVVPPTKARVLLAFTHDGVTYQPNQLIEADEQTINALVGQVDPHPDAVAYIEGLK